MYMKLLIEVAIIVAVAIVALPFGRPSSGHGARCVGHAATPWCRGGGQGRSRLAGRGRISFATGRHGIGKHAGRWRNHGFRLPAWGHRSQDHR